jgi:hypothetical protein
VFTNVSTRYPDHHEDDVSCVLIRYRVQSACIDIWSCPWVELRYLMIVKRRCGLSIA